MNPNWDRSVDGVDISFLIRIVALKFRFLSAWTGGIVGPGGPHGTAGHMARLAATMATGFGVPEVSDDVQTSVDFEVGTTNNLDMAFSVGDAPSVTDDGTFEVRVPVALIVRGRGHKSRTELLHCSRLVAQCVSVYGDGEEAYRPAFFFNVTWFDNADYDGATPTPLPSAVPKPLALARCPRLCRRPSRQSCPGPLPSAVPTPRPFAFPSPLPSAVPTPLPSGAPTALPLPAPALTPSLTPAPSAFTTPAPTL